MYLGIITRNILLLRKMNNSRQGESYFSFFSKKSLLVVKCSVSNIEEQTTISFRLIF